MAVFKTDMKKQATVPNAIAAKKRIVRKSAKAATKGAAYASYVRDHEKAYRMLAVIEDTTLDSIRSIVANALAKRQA